MPVKDELAQHMSAERKVNGKEGRSCIALGLTTPGAVGPQVPESNSPLNVL